MPTVTSPALVENPARWTPWRGSRLFRPAPVNPLTRSRPAADNPGMKPGTTIPMGLSGKQLTAYLEGYVAAAACSDPGGAPYTPARSVPISVSRSFGASTTAPPNTPKTQRPPHWASVTPPSLRRDRQAGSFLLPDPSERSLGRFTFTRSSH